jgi:hypothetical protein
MSPLILEQNRLMARIRVGAMARYTGFYGARRPMRHDSPLWKATPQKRDLFFSGANGPKVGGKDPRWVPKRTPIPLAKCASSPPLWPQSDY